MEKLVKLTKIARGTIHIKYPMEVISSVCMAPNARTFMKTLIPNYRMSDGVKRMLLY